MARQRLGGPATGLASADVSADGRVVAFVSLARLAAADANAVDDVYVFDRTTARLQLESVTAAGSAADGSSQQPRISGDGRFLVFSTVAPNIVGARSSRNTAPSSSQRPGAASSSRNSCGRPHRASPASR